MDTQNIVLLLVVVAAGQFMARILGKGVAHILQIGATIILVATLLRHFPEATSTVTRVSDLLWPTIQGLIDNGGKQVAEVLRGFWSR